MFVQVVKLINVILFLKAAVSAICNPPQPGDESYETFIKVGSKVCFELTVLNDLQADTYTAYYGG